jgi:hypothetical protein
MKPYVYRIKHKITKEFYYGVQYNKNANPSDFWVKYFTSSSYIHTIVENEGKDTFDIKICKVFNTPEDACAYEEKIIDKVMLFNGCLNKQNRLKFNPIWHEERTSKTHVSKLIVGPDGLNSYQRGGAKMKGVNKSKEHIDKMIATKSKIGDDGLTIFQRSAKYGENNASTRDEVKSKISCSIKKLHDEGGIFNTEESKRKERDTKSKIGDDGLNTYQRHSLQISGDLNVMYDTIWVNNSLEELRVDRSNIPDGYVLGRLKTIKGHKYEDKECPHCGKIGSGGNMKRYHFENCKNKDNNE